MPHPHSSRPVLGFVLAAFALGACQAIAGIEDRKLDPQTAAARSSSKQCKDYCASVMAVCTDEFAVYATEELCLGVCGQLDPGDPIEPTGNTVACRAKQAEFAAPEPKDHCKAAGPGG